jgi:type VI secretion system protein VasD
LAAAQKAKDGAPTLSDKVQDAMLDKATDVAGQSAQNAADKTLNSLVDSVK